MLILAANDNRLYASVYNNGSANLFLAWGPLAGLAAFTARVVPGAFYEVPHGRNPYLGQLSGIWAGTGGNAQITEAT